MSNKKEDQVFVCIFRNLVNQDYGIHFRINGFQMACGLHESPYQTGLAGGNIDKHSAKAIIKFLQDFVEGKI